jgi:hypothetical protein
MARTKAQKKRASQNRKHEVKHAPAGAQTSRLANKPTQKSADDLFQYDTSLIISDLLRTVIASTIVGGILVALYFLL